MKKHVRLMICILMSVMVLVACGQKTPKVDQNQPEVEFTDREKLDMGFLQVYIPKTWQYDKEKMQKTDSFSVVTFFDGEQADSSTSTVKVEATKEDTYQFRSKLFTNAVDLKDYADGKVKTTAIGNAEYVNLPEKYGQTLYMYRHTPSGISYTISVKGEKDNDVIQELFEGIIVDLKDTGNKEAPWPWDGQAIAPEVEKQMVGTYTISPKFIPFDEPETNFHSTDHRFMKYENQLFLLFQHDLHTYEWKEKGLKHVSTLELDDEYEYVSLGKDGMLYLSQGVFEVIGVKDGKKALQTTVKGDLAMHPSGDWGISFWNSTDPQKVTNQNGNLTAEPWILTGLNDDANRQGPFSSIDNVEITQQYIMVAGKIADEDDATKIIVYSHDGNPLFTLGGGGSQHDDLLGFITGMAETENGFVAIDGNMREIQFWTKDGTHIGSIDSDDLFGTNYPWLEDMQRLEDGEILVMLTQKREDHSAEEVLLFSFTGF